MSKIQQTLADATEIEPSKRANETITDQAYLMRLALGVQKLPDDAWNALSTECQDWFNKAADAIEAKREIPAFPDLPQAEPTPTTRRRGATAEPVKEVPFTSKDAKKGDMVVAVNKRGRTVEGKVVEADDQGLVIEGADGQDIELDHDKIESIKRMGGTAAAVVEPDVAEVGDTVQVTTKRGKVVMGNIKELTDKDVVLVDAAGEIHEFDLDRLDGGITVKVKAAGGGRGFTAEAKAEVKSNGATRAAPTQDTKSPRTSTSANGGVSVTGRIRELIADDLTATKEAISAQMKKEGLEFKPATLDLTYGDMHKIISILRDRKVIR